MTHSRPPADRLATADYGGRAPLQRCGICHTLYREAECPACGGDETPPAGAARDKASGRVDASAGRPGVAGLVSAPLPSLGVSSLTWPAAADHAPAAGLFGGADPLAGFSLNNPVAYAVRWMIARGMQPADFEWPQILADCRAGEDPFTRRFARDGWWPPAERIGKAGAVAEAA